MKKLLSILLLLLFINLGVSAEQDIELLRDVIRVDNGFSKMFNNKMADYQKNTSGLYTGKLEIDLNSFIRAVDDSNKSYRAFIGKYAVVIYGVEKNILGIEKMSYFGFTNIFSISDETMFQEAMLEFIALMYVTVLSSDNSFTTKDADIVIFEKIDYKKLIAENETQFIIRHKNKTFELTAYKDPYLDIFVVLKFIAFPND